MKISRKIKKELKKLILSQIDPDWSSKNVRIDQVKKHYLYAERRPTFKTLTVTSYRLIQ